MRLGLGLRMGGAAPSVAITSLDQIAGLYVALLAGTEDTTDAAAATVTQDLSTWTESNATWDAAETPAGLVESTDAVDTVIHRSFSDSSGMEVGALAVFRLKFSSLDVDRHIHQRCSGATANRAIWDNDNGTLTTGLGAGFVAAEIDQNERAVDCRLYYSAAGATDNQQIWASVSGLADPDYQGDGRTVCSVDLIDCSQERVSAWGNDPALSGPGAAQATAGSMPLVLDDFQAGRTVYRFDGADDREDFAADIFGSTSAFTLPLVFRAGTTASGTILSTDSATAPVVALVSGRLRVSFGAAYGEIVFADTRGFHAVIVRYDGSQATNATRLRIWVDGVEWGMTYSGTIPASFDAPTAARIGDNQTPDDPFSGFIGEMDVYSQAMSTVDVGRLADFEATRWGLTRFTSRRVVIILGQSNAVGGGSNPDKGLYPYLFAEDGTGTRDWVSVSPKATGTHGAEIVICQALAARGIQPVVIKYAVNGTRLAASVATDDWLPSEVETYPDARDWILARLAELNASASELRTVWWQGEDDTVNALYYSVYEANLGTFTAQLRADLGAASMSIVAMLISESADLDADGIAAVRAAMTAWSASAPSINLTHDLNAQGYPANDGIHFDGTQQDSAGTAVAALI